MPGFARVARIVLILLIMLAAPIMSLGVASENVVHDSWDVIFLAGAKIGFAHTEILLREEDGQDRYVTRMETEMKMLRGSSTARMELSNEVVENEQGQILSFRMRMAVSDQPVKMTGHFTDGKLLVKQTILGKSKEYEIKVPSGTVGPYGALRLTREKGFKSGTKYTIETFEAQSAKPLSMDIEVLGDEVVDVLGKKMSLHKLLVKQSILPAITIHEWCDDDGDVFKTQIKQLAMITLRATEEDALRAASGAKVDLLKALSAHCNMLIPHPYITEAATFRIIYSGASSSVIKIPSDEIQSVEPCERGLQVKSIPQSSNSDEAPSLPISAPGMAEYLTPSAYIQSDDAQIVKMAKDAVGDQKNAYEAAKALCSWVSKNISLKNYSVGFATAGEVAERLEGDCTEHAVLLAALLRAVGIPGRCAVGLIYADGSFYYHIWNEAFVSGWVPLDATLNRGGNDWDAVHIKVLDSALNSPAPMLELTSLLPMMGKVKVEVLSLRYEGRTLDVKDPGKLSFVMGNSYESLLYSFKVSKPKRATFDPASDPFTSKTILSVHAPAYSNAELTIEIEPVGFTLGPRDLVSKLTASGKELSKIHYCRIGGRQAVRFIETDGAGKTQKLLIRDRDVLVTVKAVGEKKWRKKLFNKVTRTFEFTVAG
ncbi:MAG TPA: transglutaminase-like domain-containing protein [bacterium]|nr:transglutaminase-like domain-containing protein [bacterium]